MSETSKIISQQHATGQSYIGKLMETILVARLRWFVNEEKYCLAHSMALGRQFKHLQ